MLHQIGNQLDQRYTDHPFFLCLTFYDICIVLYNHIIRKIIYVNNHDLPAECIRVVGFNYLQFSISSPWHYGGLDFHIVDLPLLLSHDDIVVLVF